MTSSPEETKITLNTRQDWCQWIETSSSRSAETTRRMIELGAAEFVRYRGALTVEVRVESPTGSRLMVWRGIGEESIIL